MKDPNWWDKLVFNAWFKTADHLWIGANVHIYAEFSRGNYSYVFLLPCTVNTILGHKCIVSFGLRKSGGPAIIISNVGRAVQERVKDLIIEDLSAGIQSLVETLIEDYRYSCVNMTFKTYLNPIVTLAFLKASKKLSKRWKVALMMLKARILRLNGLSINDLWQVKYNKKVRNAVRRFKKRGCKVVKLKNPLKYIYDIMEVNLSAPVRQGKLLPRTYLDPHLVYVNLKLMYERYGREGIFQVYAAYKDDTMIGYAYVIKMGGHAYISRFLMHARYMRTCPGEGLLHGILEDLLRNRNVDIIQYAYWSPRGSPGIDRFLRQFGFEIGYEIAMYISKYSLEPGVLLPKLKASIDRLKIPLKLWGVMRPIRQSLHVMVHSC